MAEVKLVNVSKSYDGENKAVDSINLEIIDKELISNAIKVLQVKGLLLEDKGGNIKPPSEKSLCFQHYIALSNLCEPSLKRFYIVMSTIWKSESISKETLNIKCKKFFIIFNLFLYFNFRI